MAATHHLQFLVILLLSVGTTRTYSAAISTQQELLKGFSASPQSSTTSFQPLLSDPTSNFTLGFLRQNKNQLALAILHAPSSEPFWLANPTHLATWSDTTRLIFNGSLIISDPKTGLLWSTATNGDRVVLLNTSNLQVQKHSNTLVLWQSFKFPTNTLVQDQNFTTNMSLVSPNGLYSLRLGNDFMGLYANYGEEQGSLLEQLYWKRTPLEAKAEIKDGQGPIYARVNSDGYLAMYQTSTKPVDVQKFDSFQRPFTAFLMVRLEPDGNLKGYYWDGSNWVLNYRAITETCDLPSPCGSYGLCIPGGSGCSCLDNRTRFQPDGCAEGGGGDGDLCGEGIGGNGYWVLRRVGVEPPNKELLGHETTSSLKECEGLCEKNCSCWGALYNNASGFCYIVGYPIETMLGTGDESKVGYFKVRKGTGERNRVRVGVVVGVVGGVLVAVFVGVGGYVARMRWKKREMMNGMMKDENGVSPGPYKNLGSESFNSIEMSSGQ